MNPSSLISCQNITVRAGRKQLLDQVSLQIAPGERLAIAGPSGAGKTTLLRAIAGLEPSSTGAIHIAGRPASLPGSTLIPPHQRGLSMVLQDLGLWPTLNVRGHFLLAPRPPGRTRPQHHATAEHLLLQLGLSPHARRRPGTLSGGEQQRVALGAALMGEPRALLLDEPFQALDLVLKDQLLGIVNDWSTQHGVAVLLITHDPHEARQLGAQRLVILESSRLILDLPWNEVISGAASPASPVLAAWRKRLALPVATSGPGQLALAPANSLPDGPRLAP